MSSQPATATIERAPAGLPKLEQYRREAKERLAEFRRDGQSELDLAHSAYRWRHFVNMHGRNSAWDWAMYEATQEVAAKIGYPIKAQLTDANIFDDPLIDMECLSERWHIADSYSDQAVTDFRNHNRDTAFGAFLASEAGRDWTTLTQRKLWGMVVQDNNQPRKGRMLGAPRHFDSFLPFPGAQALKQAHSWAEALETEITIYRGQENADPARGKLVSYTTSPQVARLFAEGYYHSYNKPGQGVVLERQVKLKDILAYLNPDGEYEVILPSAAEGTKVEPVAKKGGPGSGNFGHAGRPGLVGGSAPTAPDLDALAQGPSLDIEKYANTLRQKFPHPVREALRQHIRPWLVKLRAEQGKTPTEEEYHHDEDQMLDVMGLDAERFKFYARKVGMPISDEALGDMAQQFFDEDQGAQRAVERAAWAVRDSNTALRATNGNGPLALTEWAQPPTVQLHEANAAAAWERVGRDLGIRITVQPGVQVSEAILHRDASDLLYVAERFPAIRTLLNAHCKQVVYSATKLGVNSDAPASAEYERIVLHPASAWYDAVDSATWLHEIGHLAEARLPGGHYTENGFGLGARATSYAWRNVFEDFAETFAAAFVRSPQEQALLRSMLGPKYAVVEKIIEEASR